MLSAWIARAKVGGDTPTFHSWIKDLFQKIASVDCSDKLTFIPPNLLDFPLPVVCALYRSARGISSSVWPSVLEDVKELESPACAVFGAFFLLTNLDSHLDLSLSGERWRREDEGVGTWVVGVVTVDDNGDCTIWARLGRRDVQASGGPIGVEGGEDGAYPAGSCASGPGPISIVWDPRAMGLSGRTVADLGDSEGCRMPIGGGGRREGASWSWLVGDAVPIRRDGPLELDEYVPVSYRPRSLAPEKPYLSSAGFGDLI